MKRLVCFFRGHCWLELYSLQRPWPLAGWICCRCGKPRDLVEVSQ